LRAISGTSSWNWVCQLDDRYVRIAYVDELLVDVHDVGPLFLGCLLESAGRWRGGKPLSGVSCVEKKLQLALTPTGRRSSTFLAEEDEPILISSPSGVVSPSPRRET
jgi:hypothetical protein